MGIIFDPSQDSMDDAKELGVYDFKPANCDLTLLKYPHGKFRVRLRIFAGSVLAEQGGTFWTTMFSEQKIASDFLERLTIEIRDISSGKIEPSKSKSFPKMSKPLEGFEKKVLDIIKQDQPITAAGVAKLHPNAKVKDVNMAIYQVLNTQGLVVQSGHNGTQPESKSSKATSIEQLAAADDDEHVVIGQTLADRILGLLRHGGVQTIEEIGADLEDFDHDDITMALEELKSRKLAANWGDDAWIIAAPLTKTKQEGDEDVVAATETKDDGSFEIDRKTLQKGVKDAVDKMEVHQKRWAACMRTSNPTLASRLLELLASKPQDTANLAEELRTFQGPTYDLCMELKSAQIKKIRQDFHRLVDDLCDLVTML